DIFNSNSSDMTDLFSDGTLDPNLQSKLGDLQNEGMGKVWAAKMANVLPSFDAWSSNDNKKNDNSSSMGGLDSFIELTVKMQMAQAKKAMQHETKHNSLMSLEEFMGLEKVEENQEAAVAATDNETVSQDQFAKDIYAQIQAAAGKYDTTIDELKSQIFSAKS
ncbi:MAG: hypothetical protein R3240_03395, partial [Gammaproteobacteria bacterium]|nr:hypothetical protein [Gammaproteobacteria bacterium]